MTRFLVTVDFLILVRSAKEDEKSHHSGYLLHCIGLVERDSQSERRRMCLHRREVTISNERTASVDNLEARSFGMSDGDETRWMRDETEVRSSWTALLDSIGNLQSIQVYLLSEVKRIETGINERFAALSGRLNGQRTKPEDTATRKSVTIKRRDSRTSGAF